MRASLRARLVGASVAVIGGAALVAYPYARGAVLARLEALSVEPAVAFAVVDALQDAVLLVLALCLATTILMTTVAVGLAVRTASHLAVTARRMAQGELATRAAGTEAEFGELGAAVDQLARRYSEALDDLRREHHRLDGIVRGMREGLLLLDRSRRVALVNPALRDMLGLEGDVLGRPLVEVVRHAELLRLVERAGSGAPGAGEITAWDPTERRLLVEVLPIGGDEGNVLVVFVDVTDLRRLESLRRDFVTNASHELRNPVASIQSAAETAERALGRDPAAAMEFLAMVRRNADRLRALVDDLLDLSRIESQELQLDLGALDVRAVATPVLDLFRERAERRGVTLDEGALRSGTAVLGDRKALERVLSNLVDNAVKYCGQGATVRIGAAPSHDGVRIEVADDGPGIEPQHLPRLFERFYRVDAGRSREVGGTGLGLSIAKHLVEAMGGAISVESQPGRGTRFELLLPRA